MELKFKKLDKEDTVKVCSNRTFMELKYYSNTTEYKNIDRSNRTFMELKYHQRSRNAGE